MFGIIQLFNRITVYYGAVEFNAWSLFQLKLKRACCIFFIFGIQ